MVVRGIAKAARAKAPTTAKRTLLRSRSEASADSTAAKSTASLYFEQSRGAVPNRVAESTSRTAGTERLLPTSRQQAVGGRSGGNAYAGEKRRTMPLRRR